jgi:hypothetical protein
MIITSKSNIKPWYMDGTIRKVIETELRCNNMNKEDGLIMSMSYKSLIHSLRECGGHFQDG